MTEDEVEKQPAGPPTQFPGKGRDREDVPGKAPVEKIRKLFKKFRKNLSRKDVFLQRYTIKTEMRKTE